MTLMTTFNRESGREGNGRQSSRAGTLWEERERKEKFLLNLHFKKTAKEPRGPAKAPGKNGATRAGKATKQVLSQSGDSPDIIL